MNTDSTKPWQRRASPFSRYAALVYLGLVVYGSLHPFHGWRDLGLSHWAYLTAPPQRYIDKFDIFFNLLAYVPLGFLLVLAFYPRLRGWTAVVLTVLLGTAVSAGMEALQSYLPQRVPSNLDLLCNSVGTLAGALLARARASALLDRGVLLALRLRWFERDASGALVLLSLWLVALLYPKTFILGLGDVTTPVLDWLGEQINQPLNLNQWYEIPLTFYPALEAMVTATQMAGCCWLLTSLMRPLAPRARLLLLWAGLTLLCKTFSEVLLTHADDVLGWLTPTAQYGLGIGVLLALLIGGQRRTRQTLALLALTVSLLLVNLIPTNIYAEANQQEWNPGRFLNFSGVTLWIAALWPFAALVYLLRHRAKK